MGACGLTLAPLMPLTSQQKKQLNRSRPGLFILVVSLLSTPWIFLYILGAQVRQHKPVVDQQAEAYFTKQRPQEQNDSAEVFEHFSGRLGLIPNITTNPPVIVSKQEQALLQTLDPSIIQYLQAQTAKIDGTLDPLPVELQSYVNSHQPILEALQSYLLTQPAPQWELDISQLTDVRYALPGFVNVLKVQRLLLISAIYYQQNDQSEQAFLALEASWQLNQAIKQRTDLTSQTLASVILAEQTGLVRHMDGVPVQWQRRMSVKAQPHSIMDGVSFETWLRYRIAQEGFLAIAPSTPTHPSLQRTLTLLWAKFSPRAYFQLVFLANTNSANSAIQKLSAMNVCDTPPIMAERMLKAEQTSRWRKSVALSPFLTTKRWKINEMRSLAQELSEKVLWAKHHHQESGTWPKALPMASSRTCPNEHWVYTVTEDNVMTITFSKRLITLPAIPLRYQDSSQRG